MFRKLISIFLVICSAADLSASDSTNIKPKKYLIDINGGMSTLLLNGPRQPYVTSGPNKNYDLRGGYSFAGNLIYQMRPIQDEGGYNFFCGIGFGIHSLSFTENLNYTNSPTSKFQTFSYPKESFTTNILSEQISFCVGLRKIISKITLSHKLGCTYSFATPKAFTNIYIEQEDGSYLSSPTTMVSYTKDHTITDDFTFKESLCPYYGFDCGFGNKMLQPHLGCEVIYFTNDIVVQSSESNPTTLAFGRALMVRFYLGLNFGF